MRQVINWPTFDNGKSWLRNSDIFKQHWFLFFVISRLFFNNMDFNPKAYFLIHQKQQKQHISLSIKATPFGCGCRDQLCDQPLNTHIFNYIIGPKHKSNVKTNCPKKYIVGSKHKCQDQTIFYSFLYNGPCCYFWSGGFSSLYIKEVFICTGRAGER